MLRHLIVYKQRNHYAGWPANVGLWQWGNEIVAGFGLGFCKDQGPGRHPVDHQRRGYLVLCRSLDGGETWSTELPETLNRTHPGQPQECPGQVNFLSPGFALLFTGARDSASGAAFYVSDDRCRTWHGPYVVPLFSQVRGIDARTDYIVTGQQTAIICLTARKSNNREGRPFSCKMTNQGRDFTFMSFIGEEPKQDLAYAIMPSTVRIGENKLLTVIRCCDYEEDVPGRKGYRLDQYSSSDLGRTWQYNQTIEDEFGGTPAALVCLADGRLCVVYGRRIPPYGILCRYSRDLGASWSSAHVLRDDGGNWDLGYPTACQRPDGAMIALYYFNKPGQIERSIEATVWE